MSSEVDICNMALGHLAVSSEINALTERSKQAQACRRYYEATRDEVLRAFAWPAQKVTEALAVVEEFESDENDWAFSYRYPADAIMVHRLLTPGAGRRESVATRVPYLIGRDSAGKLIYTDLVDAFVEYTYKETNPEKFDPDFVEALSFKLAHKMGPQLAGGDQFKLAARAFQHYQVALAEARGNALNEEQAEEGPDSTFVEARS